MVGFPTCGGDRIRVLSSHWHRRSNYKSGDWFERLNRVHLWLYPTGAAPGLDAVRIRLWPQAYSLLLTLY